MARFVRKPVNKNRSAKSFRRNVVKKKLINLVQPMRGGIRL